MAVDFAYFLKKMYVFFILSSSSIPHFIYIFRYVVTTEGFRLLLWRAISIVMAWVCFCSAAQELLITQTVPSTKHLNNHKAEISISERAKSPSVRHIARSSSLSACFLSAFHLRLITSSALPSVMRYLACGNRGLRFSITGLINSPEYMWAQWDYEVGHDRERKHTAGFFKIHFFSYALMLLSATENTLENKLSVCMKVPKISL